MSLPVVAIIGRPNVGKSTLLNAIAGRLISIVDPTPGVTRDRVSIVVEHEGRRFELVDTGGIGIVDVDALESHVEQQIAFALDAADVFLFVTDVRDGVTALDQEIAIRLRKLDKPLILVGNKVDSAKQELLVGDLYALGLGEPIGISAKERGNVANLLDRLVGILGDAGKDAPADELAMKVAIVGKPNVGKSTLVNALAGEERVITSPIPGTTRDAVDLRLAWNDRTIVVIDTAGLKKRNQVQNSIAFYGQERSERAIHRSDAVLLLLDASGDFGQIDRKIAAMVVQSHKPCVIVVNKWDLASAKGLDPDAFLPYLEQQLPSLGFAPIVYLSALDGKNVWGAIETAWSLHQQAAHRVGTGELNRVVEAAWRQRKPRATHGKLPKIYYATQVDVHPPTFALFVNEPAGFTDDYMRYLSGRLRADLPFPEVPLRFQLRKKSERAAAEAAARG